MNSIEALKLSSQSPIEQTIKSFKLKTDIATSKDTGAFSKLMSTVSSLEEQNNSEVQPVEVLEKLEEVLQGLQGIPKESLSPEEQEMMYAIIQLLSLQTPQIMENKLQGTNATQEKLMNLLQQVTQQHKDLSATTTIQFDNIPELVGVEIKDLMEDPKKFEQVYKQLIAFIQQLETEQSAIGKQPSSQQLERMEQVLNQLTSLTQEVENQSKITDSQQNNKQNIDFTRMVSSVPIQQQNEGSPKLETVQLEGNSQSLTAGTVLDGAKTNQALQRAEASATTSTVRLSNLIEDLGEVLRGSFRLNSNQEGTQIKVSIFPEHLGHLEIRLTELNGKIAAQIFTSSLVAKEALDLQVSQLRNSLLQQGVTIDKIEISQQSSQQSFGQQNAYPDQRFTQQQQKQGTGNHNKNGYQQLEDDATIERHHAVVGMMKVDYTI